MSKKIKWKVAEAWTGKYASFHRRGWPIAYYKNKDEDICAQISCVDDYRPFDVRKGNHAELSVLVADYQVVPFRYRRLTARFKTLDEAKAATEAFITAHPQFMPKDLQNV